MWLNESFAEYLADPALSASNIKSLLRSPAHFQHERSNPKPDTAAMRIGTLAHSAILEPGSFRPVVLPDPYTLGIKRKDGKLADNPYLTSEWKALVEQANATANGAPVVTHEEYEQIVSMARAAFDHPLLAEILAAPGFAEISGRTELHGVPVRIRPDWRFLRTQILDIKTTDNASAAACVRTARRFRYDIQAALYLQATSQIEGVPFTVCDFVWAFIERIPPYGISLYRPSREDLERAFDDIERALNNYRNCISSGEWHCYDRTIKTLSLSGYQDASSDDGEESDSPF